MFTGRILITYDIGTRYKEFSHLGIFIVTHTHTWSLSPEGKGQTARVKPLGPPKSIVDYTEVTLHMLGKHNLFLKNVILEI